MLGELESSLVRILFLAKKAGSSGNSGKIPDGVGDKVCCRVQQEAQRKPAEGGNSVEGRGSLAKKAGEKQGRLAEKILGSRVGRKVCCWPGLRRYCIQPESCALLGYEPTDSSAETGRLM